MRTLNYRYQLEDALVAIEDLQGGLSVYELANHVLAQIEAEAGPLVGKHIVWLGADGLWDLLLPESTDRGQAMGIYPLGGQTLAEAKRHLAHLVASGLVAGKLPTG